MVEDADADTRVMGLAWGDDTEIGVFHIESGMGNPPVLCAWPVGTPFTTRAGTAPAVDTGGCSWKRGRGCEEVNRTGKRKRHRNEKTQSQRALSKGTIATGTEI